MKNTVLSLAGNWKIVAENGVNGVELGYEKAVPTENVYDIEIPGEIPQNMCMLNYKYVSVFPKHRDYVWYYKTFKPHALPNENERAFIEFDSAGYYTEIYINGTFLGNHTLNENIFRFDVTDFISAEENLLAVRCFEPAPSQKPLDGMELSKIPNRGLIGSFDYDGEGGIKNEVRYFITDENHVTDVYIRTDIHTGEVTAQLTFNSYADKEKTVPLSLIINENKNGRTVARISETVNLPSGESIHTFKIKVENPNLWDINSPALYLCEVSVNGSHVRSVRFGFKEIRIKNGYFMLNGKRIFLKCAHAAPQSITAIQMKACGFNSIRILSLVPDVEFLNTCDEIGLLVIESPRTSWGMCDHEKTREMIFDSMDAMIIRDRSRACIGAFYLFNELAGYGSEKRSGEHRIKDGETFKYGVEYLKRMRELDRDHIALLNSGRWDKFFDIGSVANPDSDEWEYLWGAEGDKDFTPTMWKRNYTNNFMDIDGMGDIHPYCRLPIDKDTETFFRTMGENTNPIFISEMGYGTAQDPVRILLNADREGLSRNSVHSTNNVKLVNGLNRFIEENEFSDLFPFPQSFSEDSFRLSERQRDQVFDMIRANPKICGYSLTSWGVSNEGTLENYNPTVIKPGQAYSMQTGWAPLRWSLFSENRTVYADKPFTVEAVLCNEDFIPSGKYLCEAVIHSKSRGVAYRKKFDADYPEEGFGGMMPLAADVFKDTVSLPEGDYIFNVKMLEKAAPLGGKLPIKAVSVMWDKAFGKKVCTSSLDENTLSLLNKYGVITTDTECQTLLVGKIDRNSEDFGKIEEFALNGGTVVFLSSEPFMKDDSKAAEFLHKIAGNEAFSRWFFNWLYHFDTVHKDHPVFFNTTDAGIHDLETWGNLCPDKLLLRMKKPDFVISAALGMNCEFEEQCGRNQVVCEYNFGKGKVVFNSLNLIENVGKHPFADQIILNIVGYYN